MVRKQPDIVTQAAVPALFANADLVVDVADEISAVIGQFEKLIERLPEVFVTTPAGRDQRADTKLAAGHFRRQHGLHLAVVSVDLDQDLEAGWIGSGSLKIVEKACKIARMSAGELKGYEHAIFTGLRPLSDERCGESDRQRV